MRKHSDIELRVRTSGARLWRILAGEIQDALVDAAHHPRVLNGNLQPYLHVEAAARLLPPNTEDHDMLALHDWLANQYVPHRFVSGSATVHHIRIRLTAFNDPDMSQLDEASRITQRPHPQPNRNKTMYNHQFDQTQPSNHNNRSTPMKNEPEMSAVPNYRPRKLKKKWFGGFVDWLFGPAETAEIQRPVAKKSWDRIVASLDNNALQSRMEVEVERGTTGSWLDAFNQALTQATEEFIRTQVEPLHRDAPSWIYSIRAVKIGMSEAAAPCLEAVEKLPAALSNRIAEIRMQKAHGAAQQIRLDNFYGISLEADSALLDGPIVQTLVSYGGKRFQLKFRFEGEYINLPSAVTPPLPVETTDAIYDWPCVESTKKGTPLDDSFEPISMKEETPLAASFATSVKKETPITVPSVQPASKPIIAKLRVKPFGSEEIVVDIGEHQLPYTIGREPQGEGFIIDDDPDSLVSRLHLTLESRDPLTGNLFMYNRGRHGTYDGKGLALPERFIHSCAKKQWFSLGGAGGAGTVLISLESA